MFNTYTYPTTRVTEHVHEHRAPTDQSVSLLHELEREARDKLVSVSELKDNVLNAQWAVVDDPCNLRLNVICRLKLNGQEIRFDTELERPYSRDSAKQIVRAIINRLAEELVKQLLTDSHSMQTLLR